MIGFKEALYRLASVFNLRGFAVNIFVYSYNLELNHCLSDLVSEQSKIEKIANEEELFQHEFERCVLVIDVDSVRDHGFSLASKLATKADKLSIIVGVTTLDVDSRASKFDFFFSSFEELNSRFDEVVKMYEEI